MHGIQSASRLILFSIFGLRENTILNQLPNFLACFATVANGSDVHCPRGVLAAG